MKNTPVILIIFQFIRAMFSSVWSPSLFSFLYTPIYTSPLIYCLSAANKSDYKMSSNSYITIFHKKVTGSSVGITVKYSLIKRHLKCLRAGVLLLGFLCWENLEPGGWNSRIKCYRNASSAWKRISDKSSLGLRKKIKGYLL